MTTITLEFEPASFGTLRLAPQESAREMRIAAAVQWYSQGIISQGKAAELAEITRADFLEELRRRKVSACQSTMEELREEIHGQLDLDCKRIALDFAWKSRISSSNSQSCGFCRSLSCRQFQI